MARDLRRAKSMTMPSSFRQGTEDDRLQRSPGRTTAVGGGAADRNNRPWSGRGEGRATPTPSQLREVVAGTVPMLASRTQLQVPFAARTLARSSSGPVRELGSWVQPKRSKLAVSPRSAVEASWGRPAEGRKTAEAAVLPPLSPPVERGGLRKHSENLRRTWTSNSSEEADTGAGTPSPKSKAWSSQTSEQSSGSSQGLTSPTTTSAGLGEHRHGHERCTVTGLTIEVPSHLFNDEVPPSPGGPLIQHCRSATAIMDGGALRASKERRESQELSKEPVARSLSKRSPAHALAVPGGKEAAACEAASPRPRPSSGRLSPAQALAAPGGREAAACEEASPPRTRPASGKRAQALAPGARETAACEVSPGALSASCRRSQAQQLAPGGKEAAACEASPHSGAGFTIAPIFWQLDGRLVPSGLSKTLPTSLEGGGSTPSSPLLKEQQQLPGTRESSPRIGQQRSKSKLMVPGHLPIDRLELTVLGAPPKEDPQGGGNFVDNIPSSGSKSPCIRRSPSSQLQLPVNMNLMKNLASPVSTPSSSARGKGLWRQGLSGRRGGSSPRPPTPPEEPQKEIRVLKDEKIFDLYYWNEVLQEEGDGGQVVICKLKAAAEETFPYVMKMRSKESLRKQLHEEEFRKSLTRMLNFPPHRGIIAPIDAMEDDRFYYVVMDRAMGGSFISGLLQDFEDGRMPQNAVKDIMREILEAVNHIHMNRMLHRDIKPDNLVMQLSEDPENPENTLKRVMLIDFDHADCDWSPGSKSMDHSCYGTLRFNAPETLRGEYSASSDLYSVGGILYLLMTGKMPHSDRLFETAPECEDESDRSNDRRSEAWLDRMFQTLKEQVIDWTCDPWPELPECRRFCASLLAFDPQERFSSADEALRAAWLAS